MPMFGTVTATAQRFTSLETQLRETRDIAVEARTETRSHQANCIEHNRRVEEMLTAGQESREQQHRENKQAIDLLHSRISGINGRMTMMVIGALGTTVVALLGALYAIFAHKLGLT